ncbi:MAG: flagellar biosynthesis protein FlhA [Hyphomicrobiales bacterium]
MDQLAKRADLGLAIGVIFIIMVLIMPLPSAALDMLLALSIIFSVLILMTALFIQTPLEFSSFPAILLIATMLRLSLNLASTRLILSNGHEGTGAAGKVIEAFGHFVMQGNFVIGIIVFGILVIVNFVVITKGSGRIAEVAARFNLDAMPGKQMAIDADLSAGLIDETEAKNRRRELEDESAFFGAMDGASKFVRGDAIAGLLITFINVIGGMIIGVAQMEMSAGDAARAYTLLTVGDGLVSQIPSLIVSIAAGLLVSKAGVKGAADQALIKQLSGYPKAMGLSAFVMIAMAFLPGLPFLPFMALGLAAAFFARRSSKQQDVKEAEAVAVKVAEAADAEPQDEPITDTLKMDELRVELGYGLVPLINGPAGQDMLSDQIKALRRQMALDLGFIMPSVRILDNIQLTGGDYIVKIREIDAGSGTLYPDHLMVMDPAGGEISLPGHHTTEPTFGIPATWVEAALHDDAEARGLTVVDPATVLITHLTEIIKTNISELFSYAHVQKLVDELPSEHKKLADDIIPSQITMSGLQRVLQILLAERISIRDLPAILEGVAEAAGTNRSPQWMAEQVRARLARQLCNVNRAPGGYLPILPMSPQWEQEFAEAMIGEGDNRQLAMAPSKLQDFVTALQDRYEGAARAGEVPVLLTSPGIRPFVRSIIERFRTQTVVMSQAEIHPQCKLKTVGTV